MHVNATHTTYSAMALELCAVALFALYLDARFRITDDLALVWLMARSLRPLAGMALRRDYRLWPAIQHMCDTRLQATALVYLRPLSHVPRQVIEVQDVEFPGYENRFDVERFLYKQLGRIVRRLAYVLHHRHGVRPGDTVGVCYTNKPMALFIWLALWCVGAVPALLNPTLSNAQWEHAVATAGCVRVYLDPDAHVLPPSTATVAGVPVVQVPEGNLMRLITSHLSKELHTPLPKAPPTDPALLIFTLGTTGLPKAAILSHERVAQAAFGGGPMCGLNPGPATVYTCMPWYHLMAALLAVLPALSSGRTLALGHRFSATTFWTEARLAGALHAQYVGEVCRMLLAAPFHPDQLRHEVHTVYGNGFAGDRWDDFRERFGVATIAETYGATESPVFMSNVHEGGAGTGAVRNYGSAITWVVDHNERVIRLDAAGEPVRNRLGLCEECGVNEPGELVARLPARHRTRFAGYVGNPAASAQKLLHDVVTRGDVWFRLGDLMRRDGDGRVYFCDRLGDTYRWKLENVSASEVEQMVMQLAHQPDVVIDGCVVVGVPVPHYDGKAGALVVESPMDPGHLVPLLSRHVATVLAPYARPLFLALATIPTIHNHKVAKAQLAPALPPAADNMYWWDVSTEQYAPLDKPAWDRIASRKVKL